MHQTQVNMKSDARTPQIHTAIDFAGSLPYQEFHHFWLAKEQMEKTDKGSEQRMYQLLRIRKALRRAAEDIVPPVVFRRFVPSGKRRRMELGLRTDQDNKPFTIGQEGPGKYAFLPGRALFEVPVNRMRYSGGLHYTGDQHHFVRYLSQGKAALEQYYARHQPTDILEKHFLHSDRRERLPLKGLPWWVHGSGGFDRQITTEKGLSADHGHQHYGPVSPTKIALEASHLDRLLESFERHGVKEVQDPPRGHFLVDDNGDWAFYVKDGQHRIAVMAHLGIETAKVAATHANKVIFASTARYWPMVTQDILSEAEALAVFRAYTGNKRDLALFD